MPILTQPAFGPKAALSYITIGALINVWAGVWYMTRDAALTGSQQFWIVGLTLTGLTLVVIGLLLGNIGRAARRAELPPPEETRAEAAIQQTAAANGTAAVVAPPVAPAPVAAATPTIPAAPVAPVAPVPPVAPQAHAYTRAT